MLQNPLCEIKGIGKKRAEALQKLGIADVDALLNYLPRDYLDYSHAVPVAQLMIGQSAAVRVRINGAPKYFRKGNMTILSVSAFDETGGITLRWFNQPYMRTKIVDGETVYACGRVSVKRGVSLINPSVANELPGIVPVYPTVHCVTQCTIRAAVFAALKAYWTKIAETLPLTLMSRYSLCTRQLALRHAHFPASLELLKIARKRIGFEDMLCYLLMVEARKRKRMRENGISFQTGGIREKILRAIPFQLTAAQLRVMDELDADMMKRVPMNRLLQGDVGSGKTLIALYAMAVVAENGYQGALLAPTEILAQQHYQEACALLGDGTVLLTGSMKKTDRDLAMRRIADGSATCVIGTHALLQAGVRFHRLGVVVTDEQHRFGVEQRAMIQDKGIRPDVLVMSATPIPRTLALLLFGDLDVSILDEMPPGRKPVKTFMIAKDKRADMYRYVSEEAKKGVQTYVVCPMIEDHDDIDAPNVDLIYDELQKQLPGVNIGKLHGRMREAEKQSAMQAFRDGETQVLVTTTVIEVGVHVSTANIMVIEGADRFGLSQLHQLRGRVGRSAKQAFCFLTTESDSDTAKERIKIMTESSDGFEIARKDLELRGPGDFLGLRQHGVGFHEMLGNGMDIGQAEDVRDAANDIMDIPNAENNELVQYALSRYADISSQIAMN